MGVLFWAGCPAGLFNNAEDVDPSCVVIKPHCVPFIINNHQQPATEHISMGKLSHTTRLFFLIRFAVNLSQFFTVAFMLETSAGWNRASTSISSKRSILQQASPHHFDDDDDISQHEFMTGDKNGGARNITKSTGYRPIEEWHEENHNPKHALHSLQQEKRRWSKKFDSLVNGGGGI